MAIIITEVASACLTSMNTLEQQNQVVVCGGQSSLTEPRAILDLRLTA